MAKQPKRNDTKGKAKKAPTVRLGPSATRAVSIKGFGPEPDASYKIASQADFSNALTWYASVDEPDSHFESVFLEMKGLGYSKEDIAAAKRTLTQKTFYKSSIASIARLRQRGVVIPDALYLDRWLANIKELVENGHQIREERVADLEERGVPVSIQERTSNRAHQMFESLDDIAERVWTGELDQKDVNYFDQFTLLEMKPAHGKYIIDRVKEEADKYDENPKDYSKETLKRMKPFWVGLFNALTSWVGERQAKTKTPEQMKREAMSRALKGVKKAEKAVATTFKYKDNDNDTGLVSTNPSNIIGAQVAVLYNVKYRLLTVLYANDLNGLSVKGTSVVNYDEATSKTKRAGRSIETIKAMKTMNKTAIKKAFDGIDSQVIELKARGSEEVIVVRVIR